jgi:uncharacterized damage-inducible protein DinB
MQERTDAKATMVASEPEPWLRGTHGELDGVVRQFVHSMEQTEEDLNRWCAGLTDEEMNARPMELPPVAFHLRHIARSLDRLFSYAEGMQLNEAQEAAMRAEMDGGATAAEVFAELKAALERSKARAQAFSPGQYDQVRGVGRKMLPTTVGSLIVHCAEHTQRHLGQAITTAKVLMALRAQRS